MWMRKLTSHLLTPNHQCFHLFDYQLRRIEEHISDENPFGSLGNKVKKLAFEASFLV